MDHHPTQPQEAPVDGVIRFRDNRNALVEMPVRECADMPAASHALTEALGVPVAITPGRPGNLVPRPVVGRRVR